MKIKQLKYQGGSEDNLKLNQTKLQFEKLIEDLNTKNLSDETLVQINKDIEDLNSSVLTDDAFIKLLKEKQSKIIKLLREKHKIVSKNYYRNLWNLLGMSAFGLPIGLIYGIISDNMGMLAIGLPIGMLIGSIMGSSMDKKALKEGRQLSI